MSENRAVQFSDAEWRAKLLPEQFAVLRQAATERPWSGEYVDCHDDGTYHCAGCDAPLFLSDTKFDSHCGWPSFFESISPEVVDFIEDRSVGMVRVEVTCKQCGSHLGHVFPDGPAPTGQRYCMNSLALRLEPGAKTP